MMFALKSGEVRVDPRGCVFLGSAEHREWPVWPKGFTAYEYDGAVTLYDAEGNIVAREGDVIESAGGLVVPSTANETMSDSKCLPEEGEVAAIHGEVEVVAPG